MMIPNFSSSIMFHFLLLLTVASATLVIAQGYTSTQAMDDVKNDHAYKKMGTFENDNYFFTAAPSDFECPEVDEVRTTAYSSLYLKHNGKVPLTALAFPGSILYGGYDNGDGFSKDYYYTDDPYSYQAAVAQTWDGFKLDREGYISKYQKWYELHSGLIPHTAVEGAMVYNDFEPEMNLTKPDAQWSSDIKSQFDEYKESKASLSTESFTAVNVDVFNGISVTRYDEMEAEATEGPLDEDNAEPTSKDDDKESLSEAPAQVSASEMTNGSPALYASFSGLVALFFMFV